MNNTDTVEPATVDNTTGKLLTPTRAKKIDLATINDIRLELASCYRGMKDGTIESSDATKRAYVLSAISKMIVEHEFECRIILLENKNG